ncbi:hypothetical protein [Ruegeria atlantica]|uniref:hypothetical protein n=1 Tax=Ruegeria atlantica TaxID=81569 RepID=UPI0024955285|nr:hypothetical protein [Ruegeria atlantica]
MALIGEPDWSTITHISSTDELLGGGLTVEDLAFANVDFEFPDDVQYLVLPVRTENGLLLLRDCVEGYLKTSSLVVAARPVFQLKFPCARVE